MTYSEPSFEQNEKNVFERAREIALKDKFNLEVWAIWITLGGTAQLNKPGWEITEVRPSLWQAVAISSRYRFCGQGDTPRIALEDATKRMHDFKREIELHLGAL